MFALHGLFCLHQIRPLIFLQEEQWQAAKTVPTLHVDENYLSGVNSPLPMSLARSVTLKTTNESYCVREITESEYLTAEKNIARAAKSGYMIALDEFLDNGSWNRKFLKETHVVGVFNSNENFIAQCMIGPSAICRTESLVMGCYVLVSPEHQNQGLEQVLIEQMIFIARKLKFEGILFDVYRTEFKLMTLLIEMGFKITGSLPECGYIKDAGYVDSLLLYYEFVIGSSKL